MARTVITVYDVDRAGIEKPAAVNSDMTNGMEYVDNDGAISIEIFNNNASSQTVTVVASPTYEADGLVVSNLVWTIPAGKTYEFCGLKPLTFNQDANRTVFLNPSVNTDLKIRVSRRPNV